MVRDKYNNNNNNSALSVLDTTPEEYSVVYAYAYAYAYELTYLIFFSTFHLDFFELDL
jgi:hypothetical protein